MAFHRTVALFAGLGQLAMSQMAGAEETGLEGRKVGETIFDSMDSTGCGWIHSGDLERFRALVFESMDTDENATVTYAEFAAWDPGFAYVAEAKDRSDAYTTASKIVYALWDRNGNGEMTETEMRLAMTADFRRADLDDNAPLSPEEFLMGFPIMLAMRAALRPDI
jgi:hypothetical protein